MKMTNILILTCSLKLGGAERQIYNLVSNLDEQKYNIIIACLYDLGSIGELLQNEKKNININHNLLKSKLDLCGVLKLIRIMKKKNINILFIIHTPLTLFWGILCAKIAGVKASITRFTSTNPNRHIRRRRIVNYLTLNYADRIIAQAISHGEYLAKYEGVDSKKIVVINNSVDLERFNKPVNDLNLRQEIGVPSAAPIVGIVANLRPEKGHKVFLMAAKKVLDSFPQASFLIVGDGEERSVLEKITEELGIRSNVFFLGTREDIPRIITLFDVAVLASSPEVETFSNAVFEYMAASKPVVATDVGSIAEQIIDGETGLLIQYEDSVALTEAILKFLNNRDSAKKMGDAGRERVKEKFNIQKMISEYEHLFTDLMV